MKGAYISAVEYALPESRLDNAELAEMHPQWHMQQVELQTGVHSRGLCAPNETALDLAETSCRKLFERVGCGVQRIDAVLFCTQSPDYIMPPNACLLQQRLGLPRTVAALDFNLACSGFIYGLYLANSLVSSEAARSVLLVTAETYSKWIHPDDRGPMTLFGDGAAATLIQAGETGIQHFQLGTDGSGAETFLVPAGGARQPRCSDTAKVTADVNGNRRSAENIFMDGQAVLDFVKKEIPGLVRSVLAKANLTLDAIDLVVFHQASQVSLKFLFRALRIPTEKQFVNLGNTGNTVSASIPIALRDAELQQRLKPGMKVLLVGYGVGLSWGGCIVTWPQEVGK